MKLEEYEIRGKIESIVMMCGSYECKVGELQGVLTLKETELADASKKIYEYIIKNILSINKVGEKIYSIYSSPRGYGTAKYGYEETTFDLRYIGSVGKWAFFDEEQAKQRVNELNEIEKQKEKYLKGGI